MRCLCTLLLCAFASLAGQDDQKLCRVEGRVVNSATGEAVRKAKLDLRRVSREGASWSATSDAEGKFVFEGVEPGSYALDGQKIGFLPLAYGKTSTLTLAAGDRMQGLEFKLIPQGVISGRVLDEDGEPVWGHPPVSVSPVKARGNVRSFATGDAANDLGEFRVAGLAPGRYVVSAQPWSRMQETTKNDGPEEAFVRTFYPGVTDAASAAVVEVKAGQQVSGIDITLRKARVYRVSGKLAGMAPGQSGRSMNISLQPRKREVAALVIPAEGAGVKPDGTFEIARVQPGSYLLTVEARGEAMPPQVAGRLPVEVGDADVRDLAVPLFEPLRISGAVRVEGDGKPALDGIRLVLMQADNQYSLSRAGAVAPDGTFKIDGVAPDKYLLAAFNLPERMYVKSAHAGRADVLDAGLDLTEAQGTVALEVTLGTGPGAVEGMVREDAKPVPGCFVMLMPDPVRAAARLRFRYGSSDQNGRFTIRDVAPGNYTAYAWRENPGFDFLQDAEALKEVEGKAVKVTVEEGQRAAAELIPLPN